MPFKSRCPKPRRDCTTLGMAMVPRRAGDFAQALMDLGSAICTPKRPACGDCPWTDECRARRRGLQETLPVKAPKARAALEARRRFRGAGSQRRGAAGQAPRQGIAGVDAGAAAGRLGGNISFKSCSIEAGAVSGGLDAAARIGAPRLHPFRTGDRSLFRRSRQAPQDQRPVGFNCEIARGGAAHRDAQDRGARAGRVPLLQTNSARRR